MSDQQQLTLVKSIELDLLHKDVYGVSRGPRLLGPLLSLLYINDIKSVIQNLYCHLYPDDTIMIQSSSDQDTLILSLQREFINIENWQIINKMTFNTKKTKAVIFGNQAALKNLDKRTVNYLEILLSRKENLNNLECFLIKKNAVGLPNQKHHPKGKL